MKTKSINIAFNKNLLSKIDRIAIEESRSRSELIREAARLYIERKSRWKKIVNFDELVKAGVISGKDLKLFKFANSPKEAFEYIKTELSNNYINNPNSLFNIRKKVL